jgi:uncharacterized membrane protein
MTRKQNPIGFVKTTAIGGLLFLLPLIVVGFFIGQLVPIVLTIAEFLGQNLPGSFRTPTGIAFLISLSIAVLLFICFVCGLLARRSLIKNIAATFEKRLLMLFPRYAILKDQMADTIGGDQAKTRMKPVLVRFDEYARLGFETERDESQGYVAVYLPGAPDAWAGRVALVESQRVELLDIPFGELVSTCEQLGKGSTALIPPGANKPS